MLKMVYKVWNNRLSVALSIGVMGGFTLGLVFSSIDIMANQYLSHGMARSTALSIMENVNGWTLQLSGLALILFVFTLFGEMIWKRLGSWLPKDHERARRSSSCIKKAGLTGVILIAILNASLFIDDRFLNSRGPNAIIIYFDTLRSDHLGCYGYGRDTSPNIDRLARSGVRVNNAIAQAPCTFPSVHSTFTSKYASHFFQEGNVILNKSHLTVTEVLRNNGYRTVAFSSSPIIKQSSVYNSRGGFGQGFMLFDESVFSGKEWNWQWRSPEGIIEGALSWLDRNYEKKFFLFIYIMDPHCDYNCPDPYEDIYVSDYNGKEEVRDGKPGAYEAKILRGIDTDLNEEDIQHFIDLYDAEISYGDAQMGRLLNRLDQLDIDNRTVVVFLSDHGEEFFDHEGLKHCYSLYNELIKVPLILKFPPIIPPGLVINEKYIQLIDLMPTILDILDIEKPGSFQGESFLPLITGESNEWRDYAISEAPFVDAKSIIEGRFKYIHHFETKALQENLCDKYRRGKELYDLKVDSNERMNIYNERVEFAESLFIKMMDLMPDHERERLAGKVDIEIDQEGEEQLKSLGYLK